MSMSSKYDPVNRSVVPVFLQYAIPSVIGMLAMSSAFVIDGIFVGNYIGSSASVVWFVRDNNNAGSWQLCYERQIYG